MATLLPNAVQQFIDGNGVPLAGGSAYFYVPGTFTPKNTWQDSGQLVLNTNPVVLDSSGEAVIFGSGIYRQIVFDSAGNQVWDHLTASTDSGGIIWGGTSGGSANAQTITAGSFSQQDGEQVGFIAGFSNSAAATLSISGGSPIPVLRDIGTGPSALIGGEIVAGNDVTLVYDIGRGAFHLINPTYGIINGSTITGATITSSTINTSTIVLKQATDPSPTAEGDMQWSTLFNQIKVGDGAGTQRFLPGAAPGTLYGCTIANNSTTAIDFASGTAADSTNAFYIVAGTTLTKILGTAWAVGNNQGGLFSGAVADGTYHCFVIMRPDTGVVDAGFDTSVTAANRPAAYTYYRRVGSIVRSAGAILAFIQTGDQFFYNTATPPTDYSASGNRAKASLTLTVPAGIRVCATVVVSVTPNGGGQAYSASIYDGVNTNIAQTVGFGSFVNGNDVSVQVAQWTNTSSAIQAAITLGLSIVAKVTTLGWTDMRGRT